MAVLLNGRAIYTRPGTLPPGAAVDRVVVAAVVRQTKAHLSRTAPTSHVTSSPSTRSRSLSECGQLSRVLFEPDDDRSPGRTATGSDAPTSTGATLSPLPDSAIPVAIPANWQSDLQPHLFLRYITDHADENLPKAVCGPLTAFGN